MSSCEQEALRLADQLEACSLHVGDIEQYLAAISIRRLVAERAEWSERACNLQHELNVALRERDQARFDLATSVRATTEHGETIMADRAAMRAALEALELSTTGIALLAAGSDCLQDTVHRNLAMNRAAISSLKARTQ